MARKIRNRAMENQVSIVLNFSLSVVFRLASAEPMVIMTMAVSMSSMCTIPKKAISGWRTASLKEVKKDLMSGLLKYKVKPMINWVWAMVAVQWRQALSVFVKAALLL